MSIHRIVTAAAAVAFVGMVAAGSANAMPLGNLKPAAETTGATIDNVAWLCGPRGCWWRPGHYWWGPRWHRPYRRWW